MITPNFDILQLIDSLSEGVIVINRRMEIVLWNQWMTEHSKIDKNEALGKNITDLFPELNIREFPWKVQQVFKLGRFCFFPQEHYKYLFYFPNQHSIANIKEMRQNCTISPLKDQNGVVEYVVISVYDVTDTVIYHQQFIEAKKSYKKLSLMDELTGVYNRRYLWNRLQEEFARYVRTKHSLSFLLIDIDHFKSINDEYGHLAGDYVLKMLCQFMSLVLRRYDIIGKYGDEEFGVILPNTDLSLSIPIAERLREHIKNYDFIFQQKRIPVTISIGVTETNESISNIENLLSRADEALSKAKEKGKNQVYYLK